jgi:hypothetical protein
MPVKRINPLEQHVEKILLGLSGAALLGVVAYQFVGGPGMVNVAGTQVPIDSAYGRVKEQALRLQADVRSESPPMPEVSGTGSLSADFAQRFGGPVVPPAIAAIPAIPVASSGLGTEAPTSGSADGPINNPAIPAITGVLAAAFMSTIDKAEIDAAPELAQFVPAEAPFDLAAVSVQGSFDGPALRAALEADPDGAGPIRALPKNWWDASTAAYAVELVRQEQQPDGTWGAETRVPAAPGRFSLMNRLLQGVRPGEEVTSLLREATANEAGLLRPEWYRRPVLGGVEVGDAWIAPANAEAMASARDDLRGLNNDAANLRSRIAQAEARVAEIRAGRPAGGGAGGGGAAPPRPRPGAAPEGPNIDRNALRAAEQNLERLRTELKTVEDKIIAAGGTVPTRVGGGAGGGGGGGGATTTGRAVSELLTNPQISLWGHDLTVKRGATYRYQLRLWISNPIFGRGGLPDNQQELARQPYLASQASAWSDPVTVPELTPLFITAAAERDPAAGAAGRASRATAELFTFNWGYWRRATLSMETGDIAAGAAQTFDWAKLSAEVERLSNAARPGAGPGGAGGGAGGAGGGAGAAGTEPLKIDLNAVQRRVALGRELLMLDAVSSPESAGRDRTMIVYIRDGEGRVLARHPEQERARGDYRRLAASARSGEEFLRTTLPAKLNPEPEAPRLPQPKRPEPAPNTGGGGGTGG